MLLGARDSGTGRSSNGALSCVVVSQANQGGAKEFSLERVSRGQGLGHESTAGGGSIALKQVMEFGIKRLSLGGRKRSQTHAARGIAAGMLKTAHLANQICLA